MLMDEVRVGLEWVNRKVRHVYQSRSRDDYHQASSLKLDPIPHSPSLLLPLPFTHSLHLSCYLSSFPNPLDLSTSGEMTSAAPDAAAPNPWGSPKRPTSALSGGSDGSAYSPELADADVMQDIALSDDDDNENPTSTSQGLAFELEDDRKRTPSPERDLEERERSASPSERADVPSALPTSPSIAHASPKTPHRSRHSRNISAASALSTSSALSAATAGTQASSVAFEEIGFDDGPGWTEAPEMALPQAARMGGGPPIAGGFSPISATSPLKGSPMSIRSEATVIGVGSTPSKRSTMGTISTLGDNGSGRSGASAGGPGRGLGLSVREGDVPLVLGVAVVDFNHLVRLCRKRTTQECCG